MKHTTIIAIFISTLCFTNCTSKGTAIKEKYSENISFPNIVQTTSLTLNDSCIFIMPRQMEIVDSLIIVLDAFRPDYFFHIYNKQGSFLKSFGNKGRGPGELMTIRNFHIDQQRKTMQVYSIEKKKILEYNLKKILNNETPFCEEQSIKLSTPQYPYNIIKYTPDKYLCLHNSTQQRFTIQDNEHEKYSYSNYPEIEENNNIDFTISVLNYANSFRFSPDYTKFLEASYIGAILDLFKVTDNEIKTINTCRIYYPLYKIVDKETAQITWDDQTRIGFECIYTTNNFIYTLLNGIQGRELKNPDIKNPYTQNISIFDWEGNPYKLIKTDKMMNAICMDELEQTIYALAYNQGEHSLIKINLKNK